MKKITLILIATLLFCGCKKDAMPIAVGKVVKLNTSRISYSELAQNKVVPIDPLIVVRWYQKPGEDVYWYVLKDAKGGLPKMVVKYHGPYMAKGAALLGAIDCFKIVCLSSEGFVGDIKRELKGKDLMCYCPLDKHCHCDELLRIANE